ncbi:MAG TPA: hypothetical protein P5092_10400 [Ruminococcus sp.]|nr:hypothetical protein [Ruminococcus sp.]
MNYEEGIQYMRNLVANNQRGQFTPYNNYPELVIKYPGYKQPGDYRMEINGEAITHADISSFLYNRSSGLYREYVQLLDDIYNNGTSVVSSQHPQIDNCDKLIHLIYWTTLQEEINYPQSNGANGRRLAFCRYFEAVFAANHSGITINQVMLRCNNHGGTVPSLIDVGFEVRPSFY